MRRIYLNWPGKKNPSLFDIPCSLFPARPGRRGYLFPPLYSLPVVSARVGKTPTTGEKRIFIGDLFYHAILIIIL